MTPNSPKRGHFSPTVNIINWFNFCTHTQKIQFWRFCLVDSKSKSKICCVAIGMCLQYQISILGLEGCNYYTGVVSAFRAFSHRVTRHGHGCGIATSFLSKWSCTFGKFDGNILWQVLKILQELKARLEWWIMFVYKRIAIECHIDILWIWHI